MYGSFRPQGGVEYREKDGRLVQVSPEPQPIVAAIREVADDDLPVLRDTPDKIVRLTGPRSIASPGAA